MLARFRCDGTLEPCMVVLRDCRAFRIDETSSFTGFGSTHHGKRTARFDVRLGARETQLYLEHQIEDPATGTPDRYVWWVYAADGTKMKPGC